MKFLIKLNSEFSSSPLEEHKASFELSLFVFAGRKMAFIESFWKDN